MIDLGRIGFDDWFRRREENEKSSVHEIARVISVHKDRYTVMKGNEGVFAELSGNLLYSVESDIDYPTTGDWVYADFHDGDSHAIIHSVFPRRTLLKRKTPGKKIDIQLIAANIDVAFIIQSLNGNYNLRRLERYLAMVCEGGIRPIILLSKSDLSTGEAIQAARNQVLTVAPRVPVMAFSNRNPDDIDSIVQRLESGSTCCLLGSSGVGKTTLLNALLGREELRTQTVSRIQGKGRHTTTSRQLVHLEGGAMVVDTPGMRELGTLFIDDGLDETFSEIRELSQNCRFANCSHAGEAGCAIRAAVESGDLSGHRYQNYLKMKKESEFNKMSYLEKKKRDKSFGKMAKSVVRNKRRFR